MTQKPSMVFHLPYPIDERPTGAGGVRPHRMRKAFADLGYEVVDLSGSKAQRAKGFKELKERLKTGWRPDFMYAENSSMPNMLSTSVKEGLKPFLEYSIMNTLAKAHVPLGMFYRDCFWKFPETLPPGLYGKSTVPLNKLDLIGYKHNKVHFFLPSMDMADILGLKPPQTWSALPPAGDPNKTLPLPSGDLKLFYVGGISALAKMEELFAALKTVGDVKLEMVTHKEDWQIATANKPELKIPQVNVQHLKSYELEPLIEESHVCVLAVAPSDYRKFAVPFKLFEYISYGRPILVTGGTEASRIVDELGVGWVVPYERDELAHMISWLRDNPDEVAAKASVVREVAKKNTWLDRARTVVQTLTN